MARRVRVHEFGSSSVLKLESFDADKDLKCADDQLVVEIHAVGINPVETYIRSGQYASLPELPYTPGKDGAGCVYRVGALVTSFKPGDRVWITGTLSGSYAEYCLCSCSDVHSLPAHLSFEQGACLGIPYRTAYRALKSLGNAQAGKSVLIHGATGGVGTACLQLARTIGMGPIIATTSSVDTTIIQSLKDDGADIVTTHGNSELGILVDLIVENLASANLGTDLKLLKKGGCVIVVGSRGEVTINPRDLMRCEGSIRGMVGAGSNEDKIAADAAIQSGIESDQLIPRVGTVFTLDEISLAHDEVIQHTSCKRGKVIVRI